ncbi:hypothetical protein H261_10582 [Paramagnetospirillum caucaseum]|uniref:Elements of external origin n=2 Tax=Paramagnetospirillum caucaseum TaxID=1244869 RepID=M3ABW4_9PROT|nr:hypothetical protein H261_10582 [Paramagnetospirillum caucaseum]
MKAVRAGRIPQEVDGTIDPARADAAWDAQTDPAKRPATVKAPPAAPSAPAMSVTATAPAPLQREAVTAPAPAAAGGGSSFDGGKAAGANFAQARTMHEVAKAQKARIQVQRLKDEVIDRANALAMVFKLARQERDSWVTWPARVAGQMAAEIGIDPHTMQTLLETYVRAHLNELADVKPEFR